MQASAEKTWGAARDQLRSMLSADTYNLWFAPLRAGGQDNQNFVLEVANDFCEVWLKDNYMGLLQDVIGLASGRQLQIKFKVASAPGATATAAFPATTTATTATPATGRAKSAERSEERRVGKECRSRWSPY